MGAGAIVYRLSDRAARTRARASAIVGAASTLAPALLVVVLLEKLGYAPGRAAMMCAALLVMLAIARAFASARRIERHLRAFEITVDDAGIAVTTLPAAQRILRGTIEKMVEIDGMLGGLRVEMPEERLDIPRGGELFGELRAALEAWRPVERAPRRRRVARAGLIVLFVLAIFFLPFFLDDLVGRSRVGAMVLVGGLWLAMLFARSRG